MAADWDDLPTQESEDSGPWVRPEHRMRRGMSPLSPERMKVLDDEFDRRYVTQRARSMWDFNRALDGLPHAEEPDWYGCAESQEARDAHLDRLLDIESPTERGYVLLCAEGRSRMLNDREWTRVQLGLEATPVKGQITLRRGITMDDIDNALDGDCSREVSRDIDGEDFGL